jgi:hypothetical protein
MVKHLGHRPHALSRSGILGPSRGDLDVIVFVSRKDDLEGEAVEGGVFLSRRLPFDMLRNDFF